MTPRAYDEARFTEFLDRAVEAGDLLMHAGDWADLEAGDSPFHVLATVAADRGLDPVIVVSPSDAGHLFRPLDDATVARYLEALGSFLTRHQPAYLGVGNEVNMLATDDPAGFEAVVDLFDRAAALVRELSPDTTVLPVLQYEWLLGTRGGLFGREEADPQWELLDRFPAADAIGITTYPWLVHARPGDLADDYYLPLADQTDLPVVVTEVGWPATVLAGGYGGDEATQAEFVDRFFELMAPLRPEALIWPFVYDTLLDIPPFEAMGLRRPDGSARPAWERWVEGPGPGGTTGDTGH